MKLYPPYLKYLRSSNKRGFTLFELLVTIAIVALIMGLVAGRVSDYLDLEMKKTSNHLAATIRYLYNKAITEGLYLRLVIDINEQSYWVEATRDPVLLTDPNAKWEGKKKAVNKDAEKKDKDKSDTKKTEADKETSGTGEGETKLPKLELKEPTFSQVESYLLKPVRLPEGVFFKDVMSEHQPVPVEAGQATIHFFPNGYVEHAVINLRDEDDEYYYSLETNPITGGVSIENEYRTIGKE